MTSDGAAPTTPNEDERALREPLVGGATATGESGYDSDVDVPADAEASAPEARREEEPTTPATPPRRVNFRGFTARTQSLYLGTERTSSTQTTDSGGLEDAVESLDFATSTRIGLAVRADAASSPKFRRSGSWRR